MSCFNVDSERNIKVRSSVFHAASHDDFERLNVGVFDLVNEFVVDLEKNFGIQLSFKDLSVDSNHREFYDISSGALDRGIHTLS